MSPQWERHHDPSEEQSLFHSPGVYSIRVQGVISSNWSDYLQGMAIGFDEERDGQAVTVLTGELVDQAALLGVLSTLYNVLRLAVLSVEYLPTSID